MFKAWEHIQTVKLHFHCAQLKLIWYNWESTCVKTHIFYGSFGTFHCGLLHMQMRICFSSLFYDKQVFFLFLCLHLLVLKRTTCMFPLMFIALMNLDFSGPLFMNTEFPNLFASQRPTAVTADGKL